MGAKQSRFWLLLVLSACIATAGVVADSTATIQGTAAGIAFGELRPLLRLDRDHAQRDRCRDRIGALLGFLLPELSTPDNDSQITSRVSPTIVDLVAAATTGLAGALAVGRRYIGDILPGVAIAISLVPPLAVVGVTSVEGDWDGALGALLLYLTNALAIVVMGVLVFSLLRVHQRNAPDPAFRSRPVYSVVAIASVIVVAALSLTTYRTLEQSSWRDGATRVASEWARDHDERLVLTRFDGDTLVLRRRRHVRRRPGPRAPGPAPRRGPRRHADRGQPGARQPHQRGQGVRLV